MSQSRLGQRIEHLGLNLGRSGKVSVSAWTGLEAKCLTLGLILDLNTLFTLLSWATPITSAGVLTMPAQLTNIPHLMWPRLVSTPVTRPALVVTWLTLHRSMNWTPERHPHHKLTSSINNTKLLLLRNTGHSMIGVDTQICLHELDVAHMWNCHCIVNMLQAYSEIRHYA